MSIALDSVLVRNDAMASADLDGRFVILNAPLGTYVALNDVASDIWQRLAVPSRISDVFDDLVQSHDVDHATLSRDVLPFLQSLIDRRLIRHLDEKAAL